MNRVICICSIGLPLLVQDPYAQLLRSRLLDRLDDVLGPVCTADLPRKDLPNGDGLLLRRSSYNRYLNRICSIVAVTL